MIKNIYSSAILNRNRIFSLLVFCCVISLSTNGQVANYGFSQSAGTFTPITGGIVFVAVGDFWDDESAAAQNIGFTFNYDGNNYTTFGINANGYIIIGSGAVTNTYCGAQGVTATNNLNMIAGYGTDMIPVSATSGEIRYETIGTAPSRQLVVQWLNCHHYGGPAGDDYSFQIILSETANTVQVVLGTFVSVTTMVANNCFDAITESGSVGLVGNSPADFNLRSVTNGTNDWSTSVVGTVISDVCNLSPTNIPVSGLTFTWALSPIDMGPVTLVTPLPFNCYSANETVTIRIKNFGSNLIDFSLNPVTLNSSSTATNPQVFAPVVINSGTLASGSTQDVVVTTSYNMSAQGVYTFIANTNVSGDGNPGNDNMSPVSLQVFPPVNPTATPSSVCLGSSSQLSTPPGQITYTVAPITYAPLACTGTTVTLFDDQLSGALPVGFTFNFYGVNKTQFYISSNGFISFDPLAGSGCCTGQILPNPFDPNDLIALGWEDFYPPFGGTISYYTAGTSPNRQLVVCYTGIGHFSSGNNPMTGQIILNETSNTIELHITTFNTDGDGVGETQGIENSTGTLATAVPGRNGVDPWTATNEGWLFTPSVLYTFIWNPSTWLNNQNIYNPVVTPLAVGNFSYTVTATDPSSGCTSTASVTVTVVAVPVPPLASNVTQCGTDTATLSAIAVGGGTLQWFDQPTGGPMLGTGPTFVTPYISATTNYYVQEYDGNCSGPRTTVTVIVTAPIPVTITSSQPSICGAPASATITLTATSTNPSYTYTWFGNDLNTTTGPSVTATPLATNAYIVFATDGGCTATDTLIVPLTPNPPSTATASPNPVCLGQPSQLSTPPGQVTYTVAPIPYAPLIPSGPVTVLESAGVAVTPMFNFTNLDDGTWQGITLPFNFNFYGTNFTSISVSTNGFIGLGDLNGATGCCTGQILPEPFAPNNVVAIAWEDLNANVNPSPNGVIDYFVNGTAPNRKFVVRFTDIFHYATAINPITGQIVLNESSNTIELHITSFSTDGDGVGETQGIENSNGTLATTVPGRNSVDPWSAANEGWLFTPSIPFTFVWNPSTWLNNANIYNPNLTPLSVGNFTYTVTVTNPFSGCTSTSSVTVTVVNVPAAPTSSNITRCGTGMVTLTATAAGPGTLQWWDAPIGGTMIGTGSPLTIGPISTTTTFYVEEYDGSCPGPRIGVTVTVIPADTVTVSSTANPMCAGQPVTLTMSSLNTGYNYTWSPSTGLSSTTGNSVTANPPFSITYTINAIDAAGCESSTTINLTVNPSPVIVSISATPSTVCIGSPTQLVVNYILPPTNYIVSSIPYAPLAAPATNAVLIPTGFWDPGDEGLTASINIGFNFNFFGNIYSTLSINSNGHLQFTPNPALNTYNPGAPLPDGFLPNDIIAMCWGDLDNTFAGTITYGTVGTSPNQKFIVQFTGVEVYSDGGSVVTSQAILYEATNCIEVHIGEFTTTSAFLQRAVGIENSTGTLGFTPPALNTGNWTITTPEAWQFCPQIPYIFSWTPSADLNNAAISNPIATPTASTVYTVTITDPTFNCTSTANVDVSVYPLPVVTLSPINNLCLDSSPLTLTGGAPVGGNYSGTAVVNNIFYPAVSGIGTFTIYYSYSDLNGCSNTDSTLVNVYPLPVVTMPTFPVICETSYPVNLNTGAPTGGTYSGPGVNANVFNPASVGDGIYGITYTYTDVNGCSNTAFRNIVVLESPVANAGPDILGNNTLNGSATGGTQPYTYTWYPCLDLSNCNSQTPLATPAINTYYVLFVVDANGCFSTDTVYVISTVGIGTVPVENAELVVYPNPGSGMFNIIFIHPNSQAEVTITDLIGQRIFSSGSILAPSTVYKVDIANQPDGIYILQVKYKDRIFTSRLVVNK